VRRIFESIAGNLLPVLTVVVLVLPVLVVLAFLGLGFMLSPLLGKDYRSWLLEVMNQIGAWLADAASRREN
jgi:hypothetical protein